MMKNVYSVGQVNTYIKNMFAQDFLMQRICIKGEVSNCKYHTSGHIYFTLKDATGTLTPKSSSKKQADLELALDKIREKYGKNAIVRGNQLKK